MSRLPTIIVTLLVCSSLISINIWWRQKIQFQAGEEAYRKGVFISAITGYESAIRMYLPFSSPVQLSAQRLWAMGENAEHNGDTERALIAYRSLRSAYYGTVWLYQPGREWINRCDKKIELLLEQKKE
jgi:hypothetical protein